MKIWMRTVLLHQHRSFQQPTQPQERLRRHGWRASVDSKVYKGKNKTFFFVSEEVFRDVTYRTVHRSSPCRQPPSRLATSVPPRSFRSEPRHRPSRKYDSEWRHLRPSHTHHTAKHRAGCCHAFFRQYHSHEPVRSRCDEDQSFASGADEFQPDRNFLNNNPVPNNQQAITVKIDEILPDNSKLSFYINKLTTNQLTSPDSLPFPLSAVRVQAIYGTVPR